MSDSSSSSESFELSETSESSDSFDSESESSKNISTIENEPFEWEALPLELRAMCVRKMNFKTSMKLRGASRLDKLIVESSINTPKYDRMNLANFDDGISVFVVIGEEHYKMSEKISDENYDKKVESLIISLLKYSHIKHLDLWNFKKKDYTELFDNMTAVGVMFPILKLAKLSDGNFQLALENFGSGVELFDFMYPSTKSLERVLRDPLLIPRVLHAKHIQIHRCPIDPFMTLIGLWIQYDKELGSKLISHLGSNEENDEREDEFDGGYNPDEMEKPMFALFREKFADRVVYHNEEEKVVRIKTNHSEKHIVMRMVPNVFELHNSKCRLISMHMVCQVIPATLKKEEYEKTSGMVEWSE